MQWLSWTTETFARAARERKPILLSISAAWCRACHEMDRTTYTDPTVEALAVERYIPVRVDADQRPDINDRYNLGGWPTTAFLTPTGELIGGGTYLDPQRMAGVLRQVADAFAKMPEPPSTAPHVAGARSSGTNVQVRTYATPDVRLVFASFDEQYGGFGVEPKFPLTSPLLLAMALYRERADAGYEVIVERTLDAIANGGLHDAVSGGYFRYATTRDWQLPHREQLLATNAALLAAFVEAASTFGRDIDRERAVELAGFLGALATPAGGYRGSTDDTRVYAASTACAVAALLAFAALVEDHDLARSTLAQFEAFLLPAYRPGSGIAHVIEDGVRSAGLLIDQVATADALLSAYAITGEEPYRMMAEELGHYALRAFASRDGGFVDRISEPSDVGLLRESRVPYGENCEAAAFFARLRNLSEEAAFDGVAERALARVESAAAEHGPDAARWLLAARQVSIR